MRLFVFSDLHWFHNRADYLLKTCDWICEQIRALTEANRELRGVVFCGDLNHSHGFIDVETLDAMSVGMGKIVSLCAGDMKQNIPTIPLYMIAGNHDQATRDSEETILAIFDSFGGATCFSSRPGLVHFTDQVAGIFCPYPPTNAKNRVAYFQHLQTLLATVEKTGKELLVFSHWELSDIPYKPGDKVRAGPHAVAPDMLSKAALIINGHYHHPVIYLQDKRPPVVIVGSPCYHNYSDSMVLEPRGALVLDWMFGVPRTKGETVLNNWKITRLANPHGPIYHTVPVAEIPLLQKTLTKEQADRMKLRVRVDTTEDYQSHKPQILSLREQVPALRVTGKMRDQEPMAEDAGQVLPPSFDNVVEVLDHYLSSKQLSLPKDRLTAVGRSLLEEAV